MSSLPPSKPDVGFVVGLVVVVGLVTGLFVGLGLVVVVGLVTGLVVGLFVGIGFSLVGLVVIAVPADAMRRRLSGVLRGALSGVQGRGSRHVPAAANGMAEGIGWRVMRVAARMMPPAAGRRWLAEAESFLAEAPPSLRRAAVASYVGGAAQVIAVSWTGELVRLAKRGPASR